MARRDSMNNIIESWSNEKSGLPIMPLEIPTIWDGVKLVSGRAEE